MICVAATSAWAKRADHLAAFRVTAGLLLANIALPNVWLYPTTALRADMTAGQIYSISRASRLLQQLREPLLIRGYFSAKTHPLLVPLVPQMQDLLREYEVAGNAVRVEIVDPAKIKNKRARQTTNMALTGAVGERIAIDDVVNSYLIAGGIRRRVRSSQFCDLIELASTETELTCA